MSQEIVLEGKKLVSSKRAAQISGYAQDYIGQLARKSLIEARRVGGLWYVSLDSLDAYRSTPQAPSIQPLQREESADPESLVFLDGKEYFSTGSAAREAGYHTDYVGQLARSGKILSQQIGNRWYVEKESLLAHRNEKDALLAAVQADAVGLVKPARFETKDDDLLRYTTENSELVPTLKHDRTAEEDHFNARHMHHAEQAAEVRANPLKKTDWAATDGPTTITPSTPPRKRLKAYKKDSRSSFLSPKIPAAIAGIATIVIIVTVGYQSMKTKQVFAENISGMSSNAMLASALNSFQSFADWLEPFLSSEVIYTRTGN